jgi:SAM-dependent methyltransferase
MSGTCLVDFEGSGEMTFLRDLGERAFREGKNVTAALREQLGTDRNTPEAIEIAYDLQAGSYVESADDNPVFIKAYAQQLADLLSPHLRSGDTMLDAGTGEMTTLTHLIMALKRPLNRVYATDISERRLEVGRAYAAKHGVAAETFRAELAAMPLPDKSVDIVTTNHAVEPNGGREAEILSELLRVGRRKLVLFEPCYELATHEGKSRMRQHGYVCGLREHLENLGAKVEGVTPLPLLHNPFNPTACFVVACD